MPRETLRADVVTQGRGWRLSRIEVGREPMLGTLIHSGPRRQRRFIEKGGFVMGPPDGLVVAGPGHAVEVPPDAHVLYLPLGSKTMAVEWVLTWEEGADGLPGVEHWDPTSEPVVLPLVRDGSTDGDPSGAGPWLHLPQDVASWASCLGIRATSLTQRTSRLAGEPAKRILAAVRATVALAFAPRFRGRGVDLALDTQYASQAHLSKDLRDRLGAPISKLTSDQVRRELDWLLLLKSTVR